MYGVRDTNVSGLGWAMMPRPNRRLTALAETVACKALPLLPAGAGLILGIETDDTGLLRLMWWRARDLKRVAEIGAVPEAFCADDSEEGALQEAGADLLAYLAGRWPNPPAHFGVITDGTGVAFAPTHPAPSAAGWLLRHADGSDALVAILPLDPLGPCALLAGGSEPRLH